MLCPLSKASDRSIHYARGNVWLYSLGITYVLVCQDMLKTRKNQPELVMYMSICHLLQKVNKIKCPQYDPTYFHAPMCRSVNLP